MAQLYYRYGAMNSGKSMDALKVAYNYEEQGKRIVFFVPVIDDRFGVGKVISRTGISREAIKVTDYTNLVEETKAQMPDCVLVALLIYADKMEEIKTVCWYCNKKATMILKFKNGQPVYEGEQIEIGGNDTYKSVCRKHYYNPDQVL